MTRQSFLFKHSPLDDGLGGDPGMVGPRHPQGYESLHPFPASDQILERPVERMSHVQRPSDVGQRNHDRVLGPLGIGLRIEIAPLGPLGVPPLLGSGRSVLLGNFSCHHTSSRTAA